ncbi:hypothetical protein DFR75_11383 [Nocardia ignorata]|uniref:Uncharacterized protein n=1 Tax=Nocardia ignorata TaxID=145285 RepID=A0A4R6NYC1_NOCIG|nr:hypothetical protein DFR75_11383 [Nocardia ignorata]
MLNSERSVRVSSLCAKGDSHIDRESELQNGLVNRRKCEIDHKD